MSGALTGKVGMLSSAGFLYIISGPLHTVYVTGWSRFLHNGSGLQETKAVPASPLKKFILSKFSIYWHKIIHCILFLFCTESSYINFINNIICNYFINLAKIWLYISETEILIFRKLTWSFLLNVWFFLLI